MDIQGFDVDRLPEEVWLHILKSLYDASTREAMVCLLVCKEWNKKFRTLVRDLEFGRQIEEHFPAYNLALPFVRSLKFPNLRSLHLYKADTMIGSWSIIFETLGRNCPRLESLRIDEADPLIRVQELGGRRMTKLHLRRIFRQHLRAIAALFCLEELCGYLVEDVGGDGLHVVTRLPAFRKLHLGYPSFIGWSQVNDEVRVSARQLAGIAAAPNLQELSLNLGAGVLDVSCVGRLTNLWRLELEAAHSTAPTALPAMDRPETLEILVIREWHGLVDLSQLAVLTNLKHLGIYDCSSLLSVSIPDTHVRLTSLEINRCERLGLVHSHAPALSSATLRYLSGLETVRVQAVRYLSLKFCNNLTVLRPLPPNLEKLVIEECGIIERSQLPKSVRILKLVRCYHLTDVHTFEEGALLSTLVIKECSRLGSIPRIAHLNRLRSITISDCLQLSSFPVLDRLDSLCHLIVHNCPCLERLPDLPPSLVTLHLEWCEELAGLPAVACPERARLRTVHLRCCDKLEGSDTLLRLGSLEKVGVDRCPRVDCRNATWRSRFQISGGYLDPPSCTAYRI